MDINLQNAIIELEYLTAEFKAKIFETEEERKQALNDLKSSECFKMVEQFVGDYI